MITRMDHIELNTKNLDETVAFYVDVLGFSVWRRVLMDRPDGSKTDLACLTLDDFMVEMFQVPSEVASQGVDQGRVGVRMMALRVDDMAKTIAELERKGVEVSRPPRTPSTFKGLRAEIKDPNGVSIELREWQENDSIYNADWEPALPGITRIG